MKTSDRDPKTYIDIAHSFVNRSDLPDAEKKLIASELERYLKVQLTRNQWLEPAITKFCTDWYREFYRMIDRADPYRGVKDLSRRHAERLTARFKPATFGEILMFCILGNKIDYGSLSAHTPDFAELEQDLRHSAAEALDIDDSAGLDRAIRKARQVMLLVDNVGEIEFDKFLLGYVKKNGTARILIAGKEEPMLNDATVHDLRESGMSRFGTIVSTGSDCFGLHEEYVSPAFKKEFKTSDLVIAKGQAYLEFFTEYNIANVFNVLYSKYPIVGNGFRLPPHKKAVISSKRYAHPNNRRYDFG
ncbi:MAG TPA: ARMT1-like domain-containing protein [Candidatus Paceibacterota bacterium]|nr:ARMT1-like domain-containing protein [Candidatus Paceibacterota bacterium]